MLIVQLQLQYHLKVSNKSDAYRKGMNAIKSSVSKDHFKRKMKEKFVFAGTRQSSCSPQSQKILRTHPQRDLL